MSVCGIFLIEMLCANEAVAVIVRYRLLQWTMF